jgi:hypothetical protein
VVRRFAAGKHERRIARRLEARGMPGLGEALEKLIGFEIGGRWRLDSLYAVGAEGAVYVATDLADAASQPRVVKVPLLPYHRPAGLSSSLLRHRRDALREEARNLERSSSPYMPKGYGLYEFVDPLLDRARGGAFVEPELALVMERLPGIDVDLWLARVHRSDVPKELLRRQLDRIVVIVLQALRDLQDRGFYYADLRPGNLRVMGRPLRRVRLLDAGSLVEQSDSSGRFPHVPHYLPPELFDKRYIRGEAIVPTASAQAVMAGRTLYEVATGRVPVPGLRFDAKDLAHSGVSPLVADVVEGLASGSFTSVVPALRYLTKRIARQSAPVVAAARVEPSAASAVAAAETVGFEESIALAKPVVPVDSIVPVDSVVPNDSIAPDGLVVTEAASSSATHLVRTPPAEPRPPWWRRLLRLRSRNGHPGGKSAGPRRRRASVASR